jgi:hypothetical protein
VNALIAAGDITLALAGAVILAWAAACLVKGWLHLRHARAALRRNERDARRFWDQMETRGMAAVPDCFPLDDEDRWLLRFGDPDDYEDASEPA